MKQSFKQCLWVRRSLSAPSVVHPCQVALVIFRLKQLRRTNDGRRGNKTTESAVSGVLPGGLHWWIRVFTPAWQRRKVGQGRKPPSKHFLNSLTCMRRWARTFLFPLWKSDITMKEGERLMFNVLIRLDWQKRCLLKPLMSIGPVKTRVLPLEGGVYTVDV